MRLKEELGMRDDWHEPDEQDVSARVNGHKFDNAGFDELNDLPYEMNVVVTLEGQPYARINLATLFAYATGYAD